MDIQALKDQIETSPAFVIDELELLTALQTLARLRAGTGCKLLYSIKALPLLAVLGLAKPYVDGFSVSSLFEARLADEILAGLGSIHLTTPGIRPEEIAELSQLCSHISCNSIGQYGQVKSKAPIATSLGIRLNPKLSYTDDPRHDPCRPHSKLGVDINAIANSGLIAQLKGLHFHTVYSAMDYRPLMQTLDKLQLVLGKQLSKLDWLNLGGGYLFDQIEENPALIARIKQLHKDFVLDVFLEPGNAFVGQAGYLVTTVLDCFDSDGKTVAVLDTSVNHHPQVFEYQSQLALYEHDASGSYPAILAGSTCLAGDLFGEYRFTKPLSIGDKLVFQHVGAYSLVKANRFNGYNLPDVYLTSDDQIRRIKHHSYQDYRQLWVSDKA